MFEDVADLNFLVTVFFIVVPAYMANGFALLLGGGKPLDCGKKFSDGRRIFGEGKTVKGCLLYTSPSPRDLSTSRMPSSA